MRRRLTIAVAAIAACASTAFGGVDEAKKWIDKEFQPSVLTKEQLGQLTPLLQERKLRFNFRFMRWADVLLVSVGKPRMIGAARIETDTRVGDDQPHVVTVALEPDGRIARSTVLRDVVQGFLRNPIQTQRHARIDGVRYLVLAERDRQVALL